MNKYLEMKSMHKLEELVCLMHMQDYLIKVNKVLQKSKNIKKTIVLQNIKSITQPVINA